MSKSIDAFTKTTEALAVAIPKILQLERLERLSKVHPILAMGYCALINQINSILIFTSYDDVDTIKVGGLNVTLPIVGEVSFDVKEFPNTWQGKLAAISEAFRIENELIHGLMLSGIIRDLTEGAGYALTQTLSTTVESTSKAVQSLVTALKTAAPLITTIAAGV